MKNRVLSILLAAVMIFALAACAKEPVNPDPVNPSPVEPVQPGKTDTPEPATPDAPVVQGVTADTIYIGNTAATSGAFAAVGIPFNAGLEAALKTYNDAGGYQGKTVKLVHYDDGFDAAQVTAGGLLTESFYPATLESRLHRGLFACGELLDIDGPCGGYNLQWAWASGVLAGRLGS